jgi:hypothetical protein
VQVTRSKTNDDCSDSAGVGVGVGVVSVFIAVTEEDLNSRRQQRGANGIGQAGVRSVQD